MVFDIICWVVVAVILYKNLFGMWDKDDDDDDTFPPLAPA